MAQEGSYQFPTVWIQVQTEAFHVGYVVEWHWFRYSSEHSVLHVNIPPGIGTVCPFVAAVPGTHCHHSATTM